MAQFDIHNELYPTIARNTAAINSNTTSTGTNIIDTQGYGALEFIQTVGARTDGTFTLALVHGDDPALSDGVAVTDADLLGTLAGTAINAANTVKRVGYRGDKRYVRADVVSTSVSSGATVGVLAVRGRANVRPVPAN